MLEGPEQKCAVQRHATRCRQRPRLLCCTSPTADLGRSRYVLSAKNAATGVETNDAHLSLVLQATAKIVSKRSPPPAAVQALGHSSCWAARLLH